MSLIVVGSDWSIPPILRNCVHILDLPLPIGEELYNNVFQNAVSKYACLMTKRDDYQNKHKECHYKPQAKQRD